MSNTGFTNGDVVKLKSGGPKMTIENIGKYNYSDVDKAYCIWFDGTKKMSDTFEFHSLEQAK